MLYLARVANLIVYLFLASAAVRLAPIHKWTLTLVALLPMSVYLAASLSADAMTLGLSLLVVAVTLSLALGKQRPSGRSLLALGVLLVLLALSKQAYVGLAVFVLAIGSKQFSSLGRRWLVAALLIALPLAVSAAWTYSLRGLYTPAFSFVDPQAQLRWILGHPWSYALVLGNAIYQLDGYAYMIGAFGWLVRHLPLWIRGTYWAALGLTAVLDGGRPLSLSFRAAGRARHLRVRVRGYDDVRLSFLGPRGAPGHRRNPAALLPADRSALALAAARQCEVGRQPILAVHRAHRGDVGDEHRGGCDVVDSGKEVLRVIEEVGLTHLASYFYT